MKKRRKSQQRVSERSITSFCVILINDPYIFEGQPSVLLVNNIADRDQDPPPLNPLYIGDKPKVKRQDKGSGLGMPGGGREDNELPAEAASNELQKETGFVPRNLKGLFVQPKIILSENGIRKAGIPFEIGAERSYDLPPTHTAIENVVCVYSGEIEWNGSNLQRILHELKEDCEISQEQIAQEGLYVWLKRAGSSTGDLTAEELSSLDIEELNEISMIGVFPLGIIQRILAQGFPRWSKPFYKSHIIWVAAACRQINVMKKEFDRAFMNFENNGGTFIHTPYENALGYLAKMSGANVSQLV